MKISFQRSFFLFIIVVWLYGCAGDEDPPLSKIPRETNAAPIQKCTYNIYLENSLSLNGYLNVSGDSNFKSNVYGLITTISGLEEKKSLNLYDVNKTLIPVAINADASQVSQYIETLNAEVFRKRSSAKGGDQSQSDLGSILKNLLDSTTTNNIQVLVSDGVFSPGRNRDAQNYLDQQKNSIHAYVAENLRKQEFATLVLQFYSDFKGTYYYQDDTRSNDKFFERRPYYIICFGPEAALNNLLKVIEQQNKFEGFQDFLFLTGKKKYDVRESILQYNDCYEYDPDDPLVITDVTAGGKDNRFRIKMGVDLVRIPANTVYLEDNNNYNVSNGYAVESIQPSVRSGFTHEIILVASRPILGPIKLSLKRQLPAWVGSSSIDSDKGWSAEALSGKTFGIRYLLEGINDAYYNHHHTFEYFSISILVKE
jgi:hypothetical protein